MTQQWVNEKEFEKVSHNNYSKNQPFPHISIEAGFNSDKLLNLVKELEKEEYYLEDHDLYQFLRTVDFKHSKNDFIKEFRTTIFSKKFMKHIEKITGLSLKKNSGDLHSLKLLNTHYLLCHDDQVQMRAVAFILNLSSNWSQEDGGELELFSINSQGNPNKVVKKIIPKFNQFNLFTVSDKSFHQISEVISKEKARISISGWFYLENEKK